MLTRLYVVAYHGDNRATWECEASHRWKGALIDRRSGQARFLDPDRDSEAFERTASWWSRAKGGCSGNCVRCDRAGSSSPLPDTHTGAVFLPCAGSDPDPRPPEGPIQHRGP